LDFELLDRFQSNIQNPQSKIVTLFSNQKFNIQYSKSHFRLTSDFQSKIQNLKFNIVFETTPPSPPTPLPSKMAVPTPNHA
jgi:hypothetical protein